MRESIRSAEPQKLEALRSYDLTPRDILGYNRSKPLLDTIRKRDQEIEVLKENIFLDKMRWAVISLPKNVNMSEEEVLDAQLLVKIVPELVKEIKSILRKKQRLLITTMDFKLYKI